MPKPTHYELLGVRPDATPAHIKKIYKKRALELHPDKNPNGAELFKEVSLAYNVLSDEDKRKEYDAELHREEVRNMYKEAQANGHPGYHAPASYAPQQHPTTSHYGSSPYMSDPYDPFFAGAEPHGQSSYSPYEAPPPVPSHYGSFTRTTTYTTRPTTSPLPPHHVPPPQHSHPSHSHTTHTTHTTVPVQHTHTAVPTQQHTHPVPTRTTHTTHIIPPQPPPQPPARREPEPSLPRRHTTPDLRAEAEGRRIEAEARRIETERARIEEERRRQDDARRRMQEVEERRVGTLKSLTDSIAENKRRKQRLLEEIENEEKRYQLRRAELGDGWAEPILAKIFQQRDIHLRELERMQNSVNDSSPTGTGGAGSVKRKTVK